MSTFLAGAFGLSAARAAPATNSARTAAGTKRRNMHDLLAGWNRWESDAVSRPSAYHIGAPRPAGIRRRVPDRHRIMGHRIIRQKTIHQEGRGARSLPPPLPSLMILCPMIL